MPNNEFAARRKLIKWGGLASLAPFLPISVSVASTSETKTIKPPKLKKGDRIGLIAPGSAIFDPSAIQEFAKVLESLGLKAVFGRTLTLQYGNLAGPDEVRAGELNQMFTDPSIQGIFAMRGGWGCARILPMIDFESIRQNPKVFLGYSDVTALLLAIYEKAGLATFHGPMGYSTWEGFSLKNAVDMLLKGKSSKLKHPKGEPAITTISPGEATGPMVGGNLSVLSGLMGTGFLPDWNGKILFLEEIGEEVYRIDRMLTQLKIAGVLEQLNGFVFGRCVRCEPEYPSHSLTLERLFNDHIKPLGIPACSGTMIGHIKDKLTIPLGVNVRMDASDGSIKLLEPAVSG